MGNLPGPSTAPPPPAAKDDRPSAEPGPREPDARYVVAPEEVMQPDRTPFARLSLDEVVIRTVAFSAVLVAIFVGLLVLAGFLFGLW